MMAVLCSARHTQTHLYHHTDIPDKVPNWFSLLMATSAAPQPSNVAPKALLTLQEKSIFNRELRHIYVSKEGRIFGRNHF